jgi:uncharacterized flavoprotein (TIGR03862 family)
MNQPPDAQPAPVSANPTAESSPRFPSQGSSQDLSSLPAPAPAPPTIVVVGGGPAGLMAAQTCVEGGARVVLCDAMPSVGRKLLLAGKGGLNLTHSEPSDAFASRYGDRRAQLQPMIEAFGPSALRAWAADLGIDTFVGSSGRVFPREMKAAPLLRAWMRRLREAGVEFHSRCRWLGSIVVPPAGEPGRLRIAFVRQAGAEADGPPAETAPVFEADAVILALGGGSWPRLGSDGAWVPWLAERDVAVAPLAPANCGFDCGWSEHFAQRWAGAPMKSVALTLAGDDDGGDAQAEMVRGEFVVTASGVEGSLVYRVAAAARERIAAVGRASLLVDLLPDRRRNWLQERLERSRGTLSLANHLRRSVGLDGVKAALLRECLPAAATSSPQELAKAIKRLPVPLLAPRPLAEAISTAGGVRFEALGPRLMCRSLPGVFCAGEMLDWEAPTGGYLLTACFATGRAAGLGALAWKSEIGVRTNSKTPKL